MMKILKIGDKFAYKNEIYTVNRKGIFFVYVSKLTEEGYEDCRLNFFQVMFGMSDTLDIKAVEDFPSIMLSNFTGFDFVFRNIEMKSMEGFLQGLKYSDLEKQNKCFGYKGRKAKKFGCKTDWKKEQTLYFQKHPIKRDSEEYQKILDEAYEELYKNEEFRTYLDMTKGFVLTHSIGKKDPEQTVLTEEEFVSRLMKLRDTGTLADIKNKEQK